MPALSRNQRRAAAIAKHHPEKLHAGNRGMLQMSGEQLEEYASTPERKLPRKAKPRRKSKGKLHWSQKIRD